MSIIPVILCGGSGTRLWPLSTCDIPKQFIKIQNQGTFLEQTVNRVNECTDFLSKKYEIINPVFVMHKNHDLPEELKKTPNDIVYENYANDTAVAIAKATIFIKNKYEKTDNMIMLILPADHYVENIENFIYDISDGIKNVNTDNIVLFGIEPTSPESKYGYIIPTSNGVNFKEKPDTSAALELIKRKALWNSGIFSGTVDNIFEQLNNSKYNIMDWIINPRDGKAPSFDVAVLQEYQNIHAHNCLNWKWSDVGTWKSFINLPEVQKEIKNQSSVMMKECKNVNVLNRNNHNIVVIGCSDLLIVFNDDDLLIMPNDDKYNNQLKQIASNI